MKNVKTLLKNNIGVLFVMFIFLLSVIGILTAIAAIKKEQYDNPFLLFVLLIPNVFWFFFALFAPNPQNKECTDEEIEASRNFYGLPPRKEITRQQECILNIIKHIVVAICFTIVVTCFFMMIFILTKFNELHFEPPFP